MERGDNPDTGVSWGGGAADTHAEVQLRTSLLLCPASSTKQRSNFPDALQMCSPAQLRQQSEELYAVIDDILANSLPPVSSTNGRQTNALVGLYI